MEQHTDMHLTDMNDMPLPALVPLTTGQREVMEKLIAKAAGEGPDTQPADPYEEEYRVLRASRDRLLKELRPGSTVLRGKKLDAETLNSLCSRSRRANTDRSLDPVLEAICDAYIRSNDNHRTWSHCVCHEFEDYSNEGKDARSEKQSLLANPRIRPAVERLIAEAARRAVESGEDCFGRTMRGVVDFALDQVDPGLIDEPFPWKPECLADKKVASVLGGESTVNGLFCLSNTPREFIERVAELFSPDAQVQQRSWGSKVPFALMAAARREGTSKAIDYYLHEAFCEEIPLEQVGQTLKHQESAATASSVMPGIFIDVDGTLLFNGRSGLRELTSMGELVATFVAGCREKITIFTGGDPEAATKRLKEAGFPEELLPVKSKAEFMGKRLAFVIDDTPPEHQGFAAEKTLLCSNRDARENLRPWLDLDPLGALARYKADKNREDSKRDKAAAVLPSATLPVKLGDEMAAVEGPARVEVSEPAVSKSAAAAEVPSRVEREDKGFFSWLRRLFA